MILYPHCIFKDLTEGRGISDVNSATVQDRYSSALAGMDLNHAKCESCGRIGDFSVHGYYRRRIVVMGEVCFVLIMRMKCRGCNGTHAILTADMIPYCRYMTHACLMVLAGGEVFLDDRAERFSDSAWPSEAPAGSPIRPPPTGRPYRCSGLRVSRFGAEGSSCRDENHTACL